MSRKTIFAIGILIAMFLPASFGFPKDAELHSVSLQEVLSIGSLEEDILFMWAGVAVDKEENIYVTDAMDYSLKKFDSHGRLIKKAGEKGQGPGEFVAPRLVAESNGYLYVTDERNFGIHVFDRELKFKFRIPYKWPITELKVISDKQMALVSFSFSESSGKIFFLDQKGKIHRKLVYSKPVDDILLLNQATFDLDPQGNVYLAYSFRNRVEKYSVEGKRLWAIQLVKMGKVKKIKIQNLNLPEKMVYKGIALDRKGNLFVLGGSYSKNPSQDVYVVSLAGKYLCTFTLPDTSHCIYIDSKNHLYARADAGVTLKKFKINYDYAPKNR